MTENLSDKFNRVQLALSGEMETALRRRDLEAMARLVKLGADVNQADHHGNTALIHAAIKGDAALAQLLISNHADLERRNGNGSTALLLATANRQPEVVRLLIDAGVDIDKTDNDYIREYGSALQWAEKKDFTEIVKMLRDAPDARRHQQLALEQAAAAKLRAQKMKAQHDAVALKQKALKDKARRRKPRILP